ncbi:toxin-antitoxin system HicB family antitoxin [Bradyrhizobium sp. 31Argb]|uniref:toxin-antitoxin system HicB family antitoxin n=1 Tax=unclassified Bradyrhizobium TaxID=2631580 RepID=UPI00249F078F|nr:toxin-antitoxin system HicB family antitoxin [Bradyrhizobium sp. Arg237L]MDI4232908.1 toxin-antitoxin system HicB family antitoxin [Bradyrhizobium sp. Arg237L]
MSTVRYRDYQGEVQFESGKLVLRILHINDLITTEVDSASEVEAAFAGLVEDYLASCAELGREPDRPFKGLFNVRIPPDLHKKAAFAAADEAVTLNAYVVAALEGKLGSPTFISHHSGDVRNASTLAGYLRLSLVTSPVRLHPAVEGEHELDSLTGEVHIEIDRFVAKNEIDPVYLSNAYYLVPEVVGSDAFAVIREAMTATNKVALARIGGNEFEHTMAVEPHRTGMVATMLRSADQVRDPSDLFHSIRDVKVTKDMIDLAKHIVEQKAATFDPRKLKHAPKKRKKVSDQPELVLSRTRGNVIDLMDALRRSARGKSATNPDAGAPRRKA